MPIKNYYFSKLIWIDKKKFGNLDINLKKKKNDLPLTLKLEEDFNLVLYIWELYQKIKQRLKSTVKTV